MANKKLARKSKLAISTNVKGQTQSKKVATSRSAVAKGWKRARNTQDSGSESDEEPHHSHHTRAATKLVKHVAEEVDISEPEASAEEIIESPLASDDESGSAPDEGDEGDHEENSNDEASHFIIVPIHLTLRYDRDNSLVIIVQARPKTSQ